MANPSGRGDVPLSKAQFLDQRAPRFGDRNPTLMNLPLWQFMVTSDRTAPWIRRAFGVAALDGGPVWCFQRIGMTETRLPDQRIVFTAGEHEDSYDPDFYIYNDVIVRHADERHDIYCYPPALFPPTDFHTATLVGNSIFLIGSAGYARTRRATATQVVKLSVETYEIQRVHTEGDDPGWLSQHQAEWLPAESAIRVSGGRVFKRHEKRLQFVRNPGSFLFYPATGLWRQVW